MATDSEHAGRVFAQQGVSETAVRPAGTRWLGREYSPRTELSIFMLPFALMLAFLAWRLVARKSYMEGIQEDAPLETLQAVILGLAAFFAFKAARVLAAADARLLSVLHAGLAACLTLLLLEEISWGQRVFAIETSTWFQQHNVQHEISLHNLEPVQSRLHDAYILLGLYGGLGFLLLRNPAQGARDWRRYCVPDWFCAGYFLPVAGAYLMLDKLGPYLHRELGLEFFRVGNVFVWRDQEPAEFLLWIGFLILAYTNLARARRLAGPGAPVPTT